MNNNAPPEDIDLSVGVIIFYPVQGLTAKERVLKLTTISFEDRTSHSR